MFSVNVSDLTVWGESLRLIVEVIGTLAFALSGIFAGIRNRMDVFGVAVLGFLSAFGGGTLRDILLEKRPFFGSVRSRCCGWCLVYQAL